MMLKQCDRYIAASIENHHTLDGGGNDAASTYNEIFCSHFH